MPPRQARKCCASVQKLPVERHFSLESLEEYGLIQRAGGVNRTEPSRSRDTSWTTPKLAASACSASGWKGNFLMPKIQSGIPCALPRWVSTQARWWISCLGEDRDACFHLDLGADQGEFFSSTASIANGLVSHMIEPRDGRTYTHLRGC